MWQIDLAFQSSKRSNVQNACSLAPLYFLLPCSERVNVQNPTSKGAKVKVLIINYLSLEDTSPGSLNVGEPKKAREQGSKKAMTSESRILNVVF
jgi:hypothetical protein